MTFRLVVASLVVALLAYLTSPVVPILPVMLFGVLVAWRGQQETQEGIIVAEKDESNQVVAESDSNF